MNNLDVYENRQCNTQSLVPSAPLPNFNVKKIVWKTKKYQPHCIKEDEENVNIIVIFLTYCFYIFLLYQIVFPD